MSKLTFADLSKKMRQLDYAMMATRSPDGGLPDARHNGNAHRTR